MKVTKMRNEDNKKFPVETLEMIAQALEAAFGQAGFNTYVTVANGSALNISQGGRCFSVDTNKLGYNAIVPFCNSYGFTIDSTGVKGYKRTDIPTWDQRVEFNNILNSVLDRYSVKAEVKAKPFVIRDYDKNYTGS